MLIYLLYWLWIQINDERHDILFIERLGLSNNLKTFVDNVKSYYFEELWEAFEIFETGIDPNPPLNLFCKYLL